MGKFHEDCWLRIGVAESRAVVLTRKLHDVCWFQSLANRGFPLRRMIIQAELTPEVAGRCANGEWARPWSEMEEGFFLNWICGHAIYQAIDSGIEHSVFEFSDATEA